MNHGHIFYPFFGKAPIRADNHGPQYILEMNGPQKLFSSLFSESENFYCGRLTEINFKIPFAVYPRELINYVNTDTRVSGWGPLFGTAVIIAALLLAAAFYYDRRPAAAAFALVSWVMVMVFSNPESWWARFVPQLTIVPVICLVLSYYYEQRLVKYMRNVLLVLLVANTMIVFSVYYIWQSMTTISLSRQLDEIAAQGKKICIFMPFFRTSIGVRLKEKGIRYTVVDQKYFTEQPGLIAADFFNMYYARENE